MLRLPGSFTFTLGKLRRFHLSTLARIENFWRTGQGGSFSDPSLAFDDAEPDEDVDFLDPEDGLEPQTSGKIVIDLADMDLPSWERDLKADLERIEGLLEEMEKVSPADDAKLQHLKEQLLAKIESPINPGNRKVTLPTAKSSCAGLARALVLEPEILLVDEPSSGLDAITASEIDELLLQRKQRQKTTLVIVTHDPHGARRVGDRFAVLDQGSLVAFGTAHELEQHRNEVVRNLLAER